MPIGEAIKQLKRLTESLEEIAKEEPNVEIDFDVAGGEYGIRGFGEVERENYSVKESTDYKDIPHYYTIKCESYC